MPAARKDGTLRRAEIAVHQRLLLEHLARQIGRPIIGWRGTRPVVRVAAGSKP